MIINSVRDFISDNHSSTLVEAFLTKVAEMSDKYYRRGVTAVLEGRTIRSFDEAFDIINNRFSQTEIEDCWAEHFSYIFAKAYREGIEAALAKRGNS